MEKYSLRKCIFEPDETISLTAFWASQLISVSIEVSDCKFFVRKKNPVFWYKGFRIFLCDFVKLVNNSFSNLSWVIEKNPDDQIRSGVIIIHGEASLQFIKNSKILIISNIYFENCHSEDGGNFHISNYHNITVKNISFFNNTGPYAGSWCIISSTNVFASNITIVFSSGYDSGTSIFSNIRFMNISNYKQLFSSSGVSGV